MSTSSHQSGTAVLLRVREVAEILGVSVRTVWRLVSDGTLAQPVAIGRSKRWRRSDIDAFIASLGN
jgi:excisionase family DNA binding protein